MQAFLDKIKELEEQKYEQYSFNHRFDGKLNAKFLKKGDSKHYLLNEDLTLTSFDAPKRKT